MDYFSGIERIRYEGKGSDNPFAFRYYNPEELIGGKTMREQLKFALSYWHTMCAGGADMFGAATCDKTYGTSGGMELAFRRADAAFELMDKLSLDYFCFHDFDLVPEGETLRESNGRLDAIADYLQPLMRASGKKLLWGTANCFNHPRYMHGAGTSPCADVFAYAAGQIKKAIDVTAALGGDGYVFWGGREGYETLLNTDMRLELDNMARLMHMAVDYARSIGFTGVFYIEPKPKEPTKHQYDFDSAAAIQFIRQYGLEKDFKLNIEANHATLAGHTFQHELRYAAVNGMLGSIDANQGDLLLGWDTDQFPSNVYDAMLAMYEVLRMGGFASGGLNFDAKARRGSFTREDLFHSYILGMDTYALGLRLAHKLIEDGRLERFVAGRYASYESGVGADIVSGKATLASLANYALSLGRVDAACVSSGRQEYLESVLNAVLFG